MDYDNLNDIYNQTRETNQNNDVSIDTAETARSSYGDLELTKYLYESGLQNVFNDYQQNIASLSQQEQQSLQDAYYIKEMSKKYLGQYASNTGTQDVSGNLLDIYSNYQQNIGDIKQNYDALEMNLSKQYQDTRQGALENIMRTQYQMDVAKLQESERDVMYNLSMGNTGDMNSSQYLEDAFEKGLISKQTFQALESSFKQQEATKLQDIMSRTTLNDKGEQVENPNYIGDNYNFELLVPDENVDKTSIGYMDSAGNKYFSVKDNADKDEKFTKTSADLFDEWKEGFESGRYNHEVPVNGDVVVTTATDSDGVDRTTQYIYQGDTWHRLAQEQPITENEMRLWHLSKDGSKEKNVTNEGENFKVSNEYKTKRFLGLDFAWKDSNKPNSITINTNSGNPIKYQIDKKDSFNTESANGEQQQIINLFKKVHGAEDGYNGIRNMSFVYYKGKIYGYQDGKFYGTDKK